MGCWIEKVQLFLTTIPQYSGNEKAIEQLNSMLIRAQYNTICGTHSEFVPINVKSIIEGYILYYHHNKDQFIICNGELILPKIIYSDNNTLGELLNTYFYDGKICTYFK